MKLLEDFIQWGIHSIFGGAGVLKLAKLLRFFMFHSCTQKFPIGGIQQLSKLTTFFSSQVQNFSENEIFHIFSIWRRRGKFLLPSLQSPLVASDIYSVVTKLDNVKAQNLIWRLFFQSTSTWKSASLWIVFLVILLTFLLSDFIEK